MFLTSFFIDFIKWLAQRFRKGSEMNEDSLLPCTITQHLLKIFFKGLFKYRGNYGQWWV